MAGIKDPILDVMARIRAQIPEFLTVRIFNNQIRDERDGKYVDYPKPACFVEILNDVAWQTLQGGHAAADLGFRFHIVHEHYNNSDGTFEQDLAVFGLRDSIIKKFTLFKAIGCGPMALQAEGLDYDHDNIYEYIVDFVTHFIDDTGVKETIETVGATALQDNIQYVEPKNYIIPH